MHVYVQGLVPHGQCGLQTKVPQQVWLGFFDTVCGSRIPGHHTTLAFSCDSRVALMPFFPSVSLSLFLLRGSPPCCSKNAVFFNQKFCLTCMSTVKNNVILNTVITWPATCMVNVLLNLRQFRVAICPVLAFTGSCLLELLLVCLALVAGSGCLHWLVVTLAHT